jgi:hypothetical protein
MRPSAPSRERCRPHRRRRALTLAWIAGVCLVVQVVATVHLVLVRHVVCPTHGDLAHAGGAHPQVDRAPGPDSTDRIDAAATDDEVGADDHCQLLGERRDVPPTTSPTPLVVLAPAEDDAVAPVALPAPARALYRLAPKISPPHPA